MIELANVTLVSVACTRVKETTKAIQKSMRNIDFHEVLLITHEPISLEHLGIRVINIEKLDYKGYNYFIMYRLKDYVKTDFALLIQNDGYVLRPQKWNNDFLKYDYIGAPWGRNLHFAKDGTEVRVGNGGFSLRSQRLLRAPGDLKLPYSAPNIHSSHEDLIICKYYRNELENYGIKFAPVELAAQFSLETITEESDFKSFGFHNNKKPIFVRLIRKMLSKIKMFF